MTRTLLFDANSEDNKDAMSMTAGTFDFLKKTGSFGEKMLFCSVFQHSYVECWNSSFEEQLLYRNVRVKLDVVMNGY